MKDLWIYVIAGGAGIAIALMVYGIFRRRTVYVAPPIMAPMSQQNAANLGSLYGNPYANQARGYPQTGGYMAPSGPPVMATGYAPGRSGMGIAGAVAAGGLAGVAGAYVANRMHDQQAPQTNYNYGKQEGYNKPADYSSSSDSGGGGCDSGSSSSDSGSSSSE